MVFSCLNLGSAVGVQLVKELNVLNNDTTFHHVIIYDGDGKKVLQTAYYQEGVNWVRDSQTEWFYTSGNCTKQIERKWKAPKWITTYTIDYSYNKGLLSSVINTEHDGVNATPLTKVEYHYTIPAGLMLYKYHYQWEKGDWNLKRQDTYLSYSNQIPAKIQIDLYKADTIASQYLSSSIYNTQGQPVSQVLKSRLAPASSWTNQDSTNWYYQSDASTLLSIRSKTWDTTMVMWENSHRTDYVYHSAKQVKTQTCYKWNKVSWQNDMQYVYDYDANGNKLSCKQYSSIFNEWRSIGTILYADYQSGMATKIKSQYEYWGGTPNELVATYIPFQFNDEVVIQKAKTIELKFVQEVVDTTTSVDSVLKPITVYPNPSNGIYYIASALGTFDSWQISNTQGQVVRTQPVYSETMVIDITDLPSGVYYFTGFFENVKYFQKLIKI